MILDSFDKYEKYVGINPRFKAGFEFIEKVIKDELADGKYELDGDDLFGIVDTCKGKGPGQGVLEAHDKYIDIQYALKGDERIGWKYRPECKDIRDEYDAERDLIFFNDESDVEFNVKENHFAIFFPHDGHAPLSVDGTVRKVIIKVKAD